jgi:tetratricopeptide (TPR) repeat protein
MKLTPRFPTVCALALLVLLGMWAARKWWPIGGSGMIVAPGQPPPVARPDTAPADPRRTFATPYRNVRPEVNYVGDEACSVCHPRQSTSYHNHPMGRSLSSVVRASPLERYDRAARNPFDAAGFRYAIERRGERVFHKETAIDPSGTTEFEMEAEVQFVIGSGERGRAYLINRDGYLFASPLSWYSQKGIWDLSPGYASHNPHFGRPIGADCLFCHANQVEPVENTVNRYRQPLFRGTAIGCERCHGPGELHVRSRQKNEAMPGIDDTIVNPRHLEPELREAVCQQCHLQGEERVLRRGRKYFEYRPGLPLQLFFSDFVKPAEHQADTKFVGTVEQMYASRCFQESTDADKLGCTSCHDPHKRPAAEKRVAYFRARCLRCHTEQACSLPRAARLEREKEDSCIACHMPRTGSDVNHTSITDHRIPRRSEGMVKKPTASPWPQLGQMPLVPFPRGSFDPEDREIARDLGIALVDVAEKQPDRTARRLSENALPLLQAAVAADPADVLAWEAKGSALWYQGRLEEALTAFEAALKLAPERETSLYLAATLALRMKRHDLARGFAERAIRVNPWRWQHHQTLAMVRAQERDWPGAIRACQETLTLHPASLPARRLLIAGYLRTGDKQKARTEFAKLLHLSPAEQREALRRWFARQQR